TLPRIAVLRRPAYGIFVWGPLARESLGSGGLSMNRTPSSHPSPPGYLFSEMGTRQRGARTVPVRSTWAGRGALEKGDVFRPDNPLRTGTVRGPMQRDVPTRLNTDDAGSTLAGRRHPFRAACLCSAGSARFRQ